MPRSYYGSRSRRANYRRGYIRKRGSYRTSYKRSRPGNFNSGYRATRSNTYLSRPKTRYVGKGDEMRNYLVAIPFQNLPLIGAGGVWANNHQITVTSPATPVTGDLFTISRGTGVHDRLGAQVCVKRWDLSLQLYEAGSRGVGIPGVLSNIINGGVRILCVAFRNNGNAIHAPSLQDVVDAGVLTSYSSTWAPLNPNTMQSYRVLHDHTYQVHDPTLASDSSTSVVWRGIIKNFKVSLKPNIIVRYTEDSLTGGYSDCDTIFMLMAVSPGARVMGITGTSHFFFTP